MANQWFKFYGAEYLSDPKILSLSAAQRSCWVTLLAHASMADDNGNDNARIRFLTEEDLMLQAGVSPMHDEWESTKGVLKLFESRGMITNDAAGITISNWKKRQERALTSYERVKRYREKKRNDNGKETKETTKITVEEKRIEENRIDSKRKTAAKAAPPAADEKPFKWEETRKKWYEGDDLNFQLLAWYFDKKKMWSRFKSRDQVTSATKRHVRATREIIAGDWDQDDCEKTLTRMLEANPKMRSEWTLETLLKYITK